MEEKVLIESKRGTITKCIIIVLAAVGVALFASVWISETSYGFYYDQIADGDWEYVFTSMVPFFASYTVLPFWLVAVLVYFATARCSMTITNKRVYGKATFGMRVDLPMDSISAVSTSALKGLSVSTSSGRISFVDLANQEEMHKTLSNLLIERQNNTHKTVSEPVVPATSADELKKYKDLLDSGVITQEEFDAKKKQLLGL